MLNTDPEVLLEMSVALAREEGGDGVMARDRRVARECGRDRARGAQSGSAHCGGGRRTCAVCPTAVRSRRPSQWRRKPCWPALGFARTVVFVKHSNGTFKARLGLGPKIDAALPKLTFNTAFEPDVFHLAIANSVGIFIENARDPKMVARLPEWFRRSFDDARAFVLLPVVDESDQTVALLYGDWSHTQEPRRISQKEMSVLNEMAKELGRFFGLGQMREMEMM